MSLEDFALTIFPARDRISSPMRGRERQEREREGGMGRGSDRI